jgi:hypothetical protein
MCEILFSILIVGAMESTPGWMTVEYMETENMQIANAPVTKVIMVPTDEYLDCWGYVD